MSQVSIVSLQQNSLRSTLQEVQRDFMKLKKHGM
jgi:hypothetical protein